MPECNDVKRRDQSGLAPDALTTGALVMTGDQVPAADVLAALPPLPDCELYDEVAARVGAASTGERASALELALEGLFLAKRIGKDTDGVRTLYGESPPRGT